MRPNSVTHAQLILKTNIPHFVEKGYNQWQLNEQMESSMKILGYLMCVLATVVALLAMFDTYLETSAEQIWSVLDVFMCAGLALCVAVGLRDFIQSSATKGMALGLLLSIFAFVTFTESWIEHMGGTSLPAMHWLWIDAVLVVALLHTGTHLIAAKDDATA